MHRYIRGAKFRAFLMPMNNLEGPQNDFPNVVSWMKFECSRDYDTYIKRLGRFAEQLPQFVALLTEGMKEQVLPPRMSIDSVPGQIKSHVDVDVEQSLFFKPFLGLPPQLSSDPALVQSLRQQASQAIKRVQTEFAALLSFFTETYMPVCRPAGKRQTQPKSCQRIEGETRSLVSFLCDAHNAHTARIPR